MLKTLQQIPAYLSNPLIAFAVFVMASALMIWRLSAIEDKGFEGTVVGTLIMPYCSGFSNLVFAFVMGRAGGGNGRLVIENCIVNNVTNLTLILGLSALFTAGTAAAAPKKGAAPKAKAKAPTDVYRLYRLDMLFTLVAVVFFTGTLWALGNDKVLDFYDALVLVGLFVFWQILHVFEILKNNVRKNRSFQWTIVIDLALIGLAAYGTYLSVDHLVTWVSEPGQHVISPTYLGWFSGVLMVLPNAFIALYYTYNDRQDIVVSSQVGDGHICIPMCIGLFALFDTIHVPDFFQIGVYLILGAAAVQFLSIAILGRLPRLLGVGLVGAYGFFLYKGLLP